MRRVEIEAPAAEELELQRDVILAYLERERDVWLGARAVADRAGGLSAQANKDRDASMERINSMLGELSCVMCVGEMENGI